MIVQITTVIKSQITLVHTQVAFSVSATLKICQSSHTAMPNSDQHQAKSTSLFCTVKIRAATTPRKTIVCQYTKSSCNSMPNIDYTECTLGAYTLREATGEAVPSKWCFLFKPTYPGFQHVTCIVFYSMFVSLL